MKSSGVPPTGVRPAGPAKAKYLMVSRLSGLIGRMERDGHEILGDFSVNDLTHMPHYVLKMLQNMQRLDQAWIGSSEEDGGQG